MLGVQLKQPWRVAVVGLIAFTLFAAGPTAWGRNRTRSKGTVASAPQPVPANEPVAEVPTQPLAIDPEQAAADIAEIRRAVGESPVDRLLNSKNADWASGRPNDFRGISWCPPLYRLPGDSRELITAADDGLHDDLKCVNQLVRGQVLRQAIDEATSPLANQTLSDWNERPAARMHSASLCESLPMELRGVARKLEARAADHEDNHEFAEADRLRTLADALRHEARRQEPEPVVKQRETYQISTFGAR